MNFKPMGWSRAIRGFRDGDHTMLMTGLGLVLFQAFRNSRQERELIFRKTVPIGSSVVVRHVKRGTPKITILPPDQ